MNSMQLGPANCVSLHRPLCLRLSLSVRHIALLNSFGDYSERRDAREFNDFNWSALNQSTDAWVRRGRKIFFRYNHEGLCAARGVLSPDACRSIRTCRLCGLRGHCLRVEVTCNSRPIYRLFIPRNEIGRLDARCAHYLLSGPVSPTPPFWILRMCIAGVSDSANGWARQNLCVFSAQKNLISINVTIAQKEETEWKLSYQCELSHKGNGSCIKKIL